MQQGNGEFSPRKIRKKGKKRKNHNKIAYFVVSYAPNVSKKYFCITTLEFAQTFSYGSGLKPHFCALCSKIVPTS